MVVFGHTVAKEEVVAYLNSPELHDSAGVEHAQFDEKLPRLLIIEVNEEWFKLAPPLRLSLAKKWHEIWRHSVPEGIVSIIDKHSGEAAVSFRPDGRVDLTK